VPIDPLSREEEYSWKPLMQFVLMNVKSDYFSVSGVENGPSGVVLVIALWNWIWWAI
jgi:hypothetical protein